MSGKLDVIKIRREFHKYPELSWTEYRTSARIAEILTEIGYTGLLMGDEAINPDSIIDVVRITDEQKKSEMERALSQGAKKEFLDRTGGWPGVVLVVDTGNPGPNTAFRFDIDALADHEPFEKGYRPFDEGYVSQNSGVIHACGHDGHTSIGLGLAAELFSIKNSLCGKITLMFQPAEESYSGAGSVESRGHVADCDYFFSLHLALSHGGNPLPSNSIGCGASDFLSDTQYDVYFEGKSAHPCGASQEGKNAILAACTATLNLHAIPQHEEGIFRLNVGEISGGVAVNTIPPNAMIRLEYRGSTPAIEEYGHRRVMDAIEGAAKIHDCTFRIVEYGEFPTAASDKECVGIVKAAAESVPWFENIYDKVNVGGSDDATVFMRAVQKRGGKAVYFGLGTDSEFTVHNNKFDFDENVLPASVELCKNIVLAVHSPSGIII